MESLKEHGKTPTFNPTEQDAEGPYIVLLNACFLKSSEKQAEMLNIKAVFSGW